MYKFFYIHLLEKLKIIMDNYFIFLHFLSRKKGLFIFALVFGLFLDASMSYYAAPFRLFFIIIAFFFILVVFLSKSRDVFLLTLFLSFLVVFNLYAYFMQKNNFDFSYFHVYILILIGYILSKENLFEMLKPYVKFIILINLYFLINEKITGAPLVPLEEGRDISFVFYGQGIFGYTKNAADAIGLSVLLFRKDIFWKFVIMISVLLIGVRSAIIFVVLIIIVDMILQSHHILKLNLKKVLLGIAFVLVACVLMYTLKDLFYLDRLDSLFMPDSSTYLSRAHYAEEHLNCFSNLGVFQLLFGSGTYCPEVIKNGAENLHIMFFTHYGLVHYGLWMSFFIYIIFKKSNNAIFLIYPLVLYLFIGIGVRWGLGWMGGIILYTYIFNIYFNRKAIV